MPSPGTDIQTRQTSQRAGKYVQQPTGYHAFLPAPFPPTDLALTPELWTLLSRADLALGKLAGATKTLPDPDLFVFMYMKREAVLSSQIEGTQASLMEILELEAERERGSSIDFVEVLNYMNALKFGLKRVSELPLSKRLIQEIHGKLMKGARGGEAARTPGEFRKSQNWIGGPTLMTARFVPPPVAAMDRALDELETFLHFDELPLLIRIALAHAQFETIHPFQDGNGRIGRLLISFMLCHSKILEEPVLYLSVFFKEHRDEYYNRLQAIRDAGSWEGWLAFFLEGVAVIASEATETVHKILALREELRGRLGKTLQRRSSAGLKLLDELFQQPVVTVKNVQDITNSSQPTAASLVTAMVQAGILREATGRRRNRIFHFGEYLKLFQEREHRG